MSCPDLERILPFEEPHENSLLHDRRLSILTSYDDRNKRVKPPAIWLRTMSLKREPFLPRQKRLADGVREVDKLLAKRGQIIAKSGV
jgi:hypothetical protein